MIHAMRNAGGPVKILLWLVIAAFIGSIFVVWGIQGSSQSSAGYVIKVNDTEIGPDAFNRAYGNIADNLGDLLGDTESPEVRDQLRELTIQNLISEELMRQAALESGLEVSDTQLLSSIAAIPAFQNDEGAFDPQLYRQVLEANRLEPARFEQMQRQALLVDQMQRQLLQNMPIDKDDLRSEYRWQYGAASFDYAILTPDAFAGEVDTSDEALQQYYQENHGQYARPAQVALDLVRLGFDTQSAESQQQAAASLRSLKDSYESSAAGQSFAAFAQAQGHQVISTELFSQNQPPQQLAGEARLIREAFLMEDDQLSSIIKGEQAAFLAHRRESAPSGIIPFEQIRDRVAKDMISDKAMETLERKTRELADQNLDTIAQQAGATIDSVTRIPYSGSDQEIFNQQLMQLVFETDTGETAGPSSIIGLPVFVRPTAHHQPRMDSFESMQDELEASVRDRRASDYLNRWIEQQRAQTEIDINRAIFAN